VIITPDNRRMHKYVDCLNSIRQSTPSVEALCDPTAFSQLSFPYMGTRRPTGRFSWNKEGYYTFQGRKSFRAVYDHVMALRIDVGTGYRNFHLHGTLGYGKSHLICALVCHLLSIGKRVLYVPDCKKLLGDPFQYLEESFRLAFADDPYIVDCLDQCTDAEGLAALTRTIAKRGITMYIFVDQTEALDASTGGQVSSNARIKLSEFLNRFTYRHFSIRSSSANSWMAEKDYLTQNHVDKLYLSGGFDDVSLLYSSAINVLMARRKR
jgi:hypothetical protein